jgi:hypothetical protein
MNEWQQIVVAGIDGATILGSIAMLSCAGLRAWRWWLDLHRCEIERRETPRSGRELDPAARIEMADLRERVRSLEALARGVDL